MPEAGHVGATRHDSDCGYYDHNTFRDPKVRHSTAPIRARTPRSAGGSRGNRRGESPGFAREHQEITDADPVGGQPRVCDEPIRHASAPMLFWGGEAARATGRFIAVRLTLWVSGAIRRSHDLKERGGSGAAIGRSEALK